MSSENNLLNSLLSLANNPDWIFTINLKTDKICNLYNSEMLPDYFSKITSSVLLSSLKEELLLGLYIISLTSYDNLRRN